MRPSVTETKSFLDLALTHWHNAFGLLTAIVGIISIETFFIYFNNIKGTYSAIVYSSSIIIICILWIIGNRIPRTSYGKVGFVICILGSNEEEKKRVREDFIITLRKLIKDGSQGETFDFIEIPQHLAEKYQDKDTAVTLIEKTKSHLVLYGRVRLRKSNGKDCYFIELDGAVRHKPISTDLQKKLSNEFGELLPRKVSFNAENDLLSFNFTSEWTEFVAKYIIGIAAFCSGDLEYSEKIYRDIQERISGKPLNFPAYNKIMRRIPLRISEIYLLRARAAYLAWDSSRNSDYIEQLSSDLDGIQSVLDNEYEVLMLRSIEAFLNGRNLRKAKTLTNRCKKVNDVIWRFNLGFLEAYNGNLKKAIQLYRSCTRYSMQPETISQIEGFLCWLLNEEPENYQLFYCLGFFNWKIKGDLEQAVKDFNSFITRCKGEEFGSEKELAMNWVAEIENLTSDTSLN